MPVMPSEIEISQSHFSRHINYLIFNYRFSTAYKPHTYSFDLSWGGVVEWDSRVELGPWGAIYSFVVAGGNLSFAAELKLMTLTPTVGVKKFRKKMGNVVVAIIETRI